MDTTFNSYLRSGKLFILLPLFVFPFITNPAYSNVIYIDTSYYEQGLKEKEQSNYEKALGIWKEAQNSLNEPDFRISHAFIELVTEHSFKNHYKDASDIYFWGLSGNKVEKYEKEVLYKQLKFLKPIITGFETYKDLKDKIDDRDPSVYKELQLFWQQKDPTPLTEYNERLIEHWERIAYANNEYGGSQSKNIDDRVKIYIKYGKPDITRSGILVYNSGTVNALLRERIGVDFPSGNQTTAMMQVQQFNLETRIRQLHNNPEYEVWIYNRLTDNPQNTIFLFGTDSGSSTFRRKDSVEDFIPSAAFSMTDRNTFLNFRDAAAESDLASFEAQSNTQFEPTDITPGLIMQIMYYEQFAALDAYFGDAYNQMLSRYLDLTTRISVSMAREFENTNAGRLIEIQKKAPEERSVHDFKLSELEVNAYPYRFINDSGIPYIKLFVVTELEEAIYYDNLKSTNTLDPREWGNFIVKSGVQILNRNQERVSEKVINTEISPVSFSTASMEFELSYDDELFQVLTASELHRATENNMTTPNETPFEPSLIGIGEEKFDPQAPLKTHELSMGDIILGYISEEGNQNEFVPFKISHKKEIPEGKNLNLYYELYHLTQDVSGKYRFTFKYSIKPQPKVLNLFRAKQDDLSITLNNESLSNRYKNVLVIDTSNFATGKYEMNIKITDLFTGEALVQNVLFLIY